MGPRGDQEGEAAPARADGRVLARVRGAGLRPPPALLLLERGWERESVRGPRLAAETRVLAASVAQPSPLSSPRQRRSGGTEPAPRAERASQRRVRARAPHPARGPRSGRPDPGRGARTRRVLSDTTAPTPALRPWAAPASGSALPAAAEPGPSARPPGRTASPVHSGALRTHASEAGGKPAPAALPSRKCRRGPPARGPLGTSGCEAIFQTEIGPMRVSTTGDPFVSTLVRRSLFAPVPVPERTRRPRVGAASLRDRVR